MNLVVAKFGGSTIGVNGRFIPKITDRIRSKIADSRVMAVMSAPLTMDDGKRSSITDVIIRQGYRVEKGGAPALDAVRGAYDAILDMVRTDLRAECSKTIDSHLAVAEAALNEGRHARRFADEVRARALGYAGELLMSQVMHFILRGEGISSAFVPYEEWPIITDNNLEFTNFLLAESKARLAHTDRLVREHEVVCMGGFIGKTASGAMSTYERGGTDRTAADMGILLHRNYQTSVDWEKDSSVVSADPRIVKTGLLDVHHLSYNEARMAGMFGMKILDPMAIKEILDAGVDIPLRITDIADPSRTTIIRRSIEPERGHPIKIVTGKKNCAVIKMEDDLSMDLIKSLDNDKKYSEYVPLSPFIRDSVLFARILFTDGDFVRRNERYLHSFDPFTSITYNRAVITLVGDSMWRMQHMVARTCARIGEERLNILNMDAQEETSRIIILIEDAGDNLERAVRVVHDESLVIDPD